MPVNKLSEVTDEVDTLFNNPELSQIKPLLAERDSLNYQLTHLERRQVQLKSMAGKYSINAFAVIQSYLDAAVKKTFPEIANHEIQLVYTIKPLYGDLQCNSGLRLANELSTKTEKLVPRVLASKIVSNIQPNDIIDKTEVAGPGFINIWISKKFLASELFKILTVGVLPPILYRKYSVVIDMSSPNIAKEMHVGHLRSTIIGEGISRLLSFLGHDVHKVNHVGDWGTQFGMLIALMKDRQLTPTTLPELQGLQALYKEAKAQFDKDEVFKKAAYADVVKLQNGDAKNVEYWNGICEVSRRDFNAIYERLDIKDLKECGESFYQSRMKSLIADLKATKPDLLQLDEGRLLIWPEGGTIPLTMVKSDGGFTYDTSDIAALRYRIVELHSDRVIYVVDQGQSGHFDNFFQASKQIGFYNPTLHRVDHVGFGVVLGEDRKKFKTRSGDTVRLTDLLNEGLERSKARLLEKEREKALSPEEFTAAQEAVAYGCIKYADLSHTRTNDYVFSFDKMLDDKGNTAVYLLYAYTRIRSIIRNANYTSEKLAKLASSGEVAASLEHPDELALGKHICRFPEILARADVDYHLHSICDFIYELSCVFTKFYDSCYCIQRENGEIVKVNVDRLMLCDATAKVMKCCLDILGLNSIERM